MEYDQKDKKKRKVSDSSGKNKTPTPNNFLSYLILKITHTKFQLSNCDFLIFYIENKHGTFIHKLFKISYRTYPIAFVNTDKDYVLLFRNLFYNLFRVNGGIYVNKRKNKKDLWQFQKCSLETYNLIHKEFEFPVGKKALKLRIPSFILKGNKKLQKYFFYGLLVTDGCIRKNGSIMFHSASKNLLYDLKEMISSMWGIEREVKEYIQREKILFVPVNFK